MFIHVQRENGLAHRTLVLRPWQVQALRILASKTFLIALTIGLLSWGYFALQAARVPLLTQRISHLEEDAQRLDTLQRTLSELQSRYAQVQDMLTASKSIDAKTAPGVSASANGPRKGAAEQARDAQNTTATKKTPQED
jgi:biopolymer transport protein ExbB/TolQ